MRKLLIFLVCALGFAQVNWEIEIVDSVPEPGHHHDFRFNSLAIDSNGITHIVYNKDEFEKIAHASRINGIWQKDTVESELYLCYGFSLILDDNSVPNLSYACKFDSLGKTYICYAYRQSNAWFINTVDSITGWLGNYFWDLNTSIALDTLGFPGIAYIAWNVADSLHYIKYAHYNGIDWDTSIVARDTTWHHRYPLDYSPSLKFDREGTPHIAFYRFRSDTHTDTLKIAHYDDSLGSWIVDPVLCNIQGSIPVSLVLDSQDYPYIAHTVDIGLYCTWWDGTTWQSEYTGADLGWIGIRIALDLDSLDNPHIAYLPEPLIAHTCYCYKEDSVWHLCGWIESDSSTLTIDADISFALDRLDKPHVCYQFLSEHGADTTGIKYAKGTFVGVAEHKNGKLAKEFELQVFPNPSRGTAKIAYDLHKHSEIALSIYDVAGVMVKRIKQGYFGPGYYREKIDTENLSSGVYFIMLKQDNEKVTRKFLVVK